MIKYFILLVISLFINKISVAQDFKKDSATIKHMSNYILNNASCYEDLRYMCKQIGTRLTGSTQAEQAVLWAKKTLIEAGCDNVFLQPVMVPHWIRGEEKAEVIVDGKRTNMLITSLGNAVGTGNKGLEAKLIMVNSMDEFKLLTEKDVKGKIVFFNHRFIQSNVNTFESYGPCVYYRWAAPSEAAKLGAIATVIRSVSSAYDDKPHTGALHYNSKYPAIPAVAISNVDADNLERLMLLRKKVSFYVRTTCEMLNDVLSYNVVGEIYGTELPKEIIVFGGHLDSWDMGEGAHDDGAGVVQSIEVLRTFKKTKTRPKRTIRAVLFMNEENGLKGALEYAKQAKEKSEHHILAIESDAGGATPYGFSMNMDIEKRNKVKSWRNLFSPYNIYNFEKDGGGADIGPLQRQFGTPVMGLMPDGQRYFDMHHSANDVFENVHRRELCMGAVAMTMMVYLVSEYGLE